MGGGERLHSDCELSPIVSADSILDGTTNFFGSVGECSDEEEAAADEAAADGDPAAADVTGR